MTWTAEKVHLSKLPIHERSANLPSHLQKILGLADTHCGLQKAWLFGSRAKASARENSDFDLAFKIADPARWAGFLASIHDDPPSLYRYDLVDLAEIDENFKSVIQREGIQIYER